MRRILIALLMVALTATITAHYAAVLLTSEPAYSGSLRIAFASSLTGPGREGADEMLRAARIAAAEVNGEGGVNGLKVEIIPFDDANDPEKAKAVAEAIAADPRLIGVIGHNYSSASLAAGPVYSREGVPAITPSSTHPDVTRGNRWYFRSIFSDTTQGEFLARYAREALDARSVAVIAPSNAYARQIASSFVEAAGPIGLEVSGQWWVDPKAPNFEATVEEAVAALGKLPKDTIVLLPAHIDPAVVIVRHLRDAGLGNRVLGSDSLGSTRFALAFSALPREQARPGFYTDGLFVSVPFLTDTGNQEARRLIDRLEAQGGTLKTWGAPFAYDAAKLLITAARRAGLGATAGAGTEAAPQETKAGKDKGKATLADGPGGSAVRAAVREQLDAMRSLSSSLIGATGTLQFGVENTPSKPLIIGQFSGRLISSLIQLTFDRNPDATDGKALLRKTPVVYTGLLPERIEAIDAATGTARLTFDLWFRFQGTPPVADIVFANAAEPIRLGEPTETVSTNGIEYRLYHVSGRFKGNFDGRPLVPGHLATGIQFTHRTLSREQLIYVVDAGGRSVTDTSAESLMALSKAVLAGQEWRIGRLNATADIVDRPTKGNPLQAHGEGDRRPFSNFTYRIELEPRDPGLRRQLSGETALWAAVAATLALIACLILDDVGRGQNWGRARLILTALASAAFLLTSESAIFDTVSTAGGPESPVMTTFDVLWWLAIGALANMAVRRFAWDQLERASGRVVPQVIRMFASSAVYFVAVFGIFANVLQKDVTGLVATSGVLAMIIGLALQGNLSNIFSGIVINLEQPFRPGDWIKVGDAPMGKVIDISWRALKVQTFSNSVLSIPNSLAASSRIENCSHPNNRYFIFQIMYFDPHYDPLRLTELLYDGLRLTASVDGRPRLDLMWVKFNGVTEMGLKFLVAFDVYDRALMNSQEHAALTSIARVFKSAGVSLARYRYHHAEQPCEAVLAAANAVGELGEEARERLADQAVERRFQPGEIILRQGEAASSLFVIAEGVVSATIAGTGWSPEREVTRLGPGDYLGEALAFDESQPATLKAAGPVTAFELPTDAVRAVMEAQPAFAERLRTLYLDRRIMFRPPEPPPVDSGQATHATEGGWRALAGLKTMFRQS